eukprot:TRINITY_DN6479_c1_g1_i2.p2 TRINITY_DN6479_c1_g1~~TRINITY_DN6479_c1_g1_i2.p2  ORF type:complete len:105 (+),score=8.93 TRINITY_DN6479_c1_g1_i2:1123-1437(+)
MASRDKPQKSGRLETHKVIQNFNLRIKSSSEELVPLKHLLFLSFHIVQIHAKKERRHIVFPLKVVIGQNHCWNNSDKDCGSTQLQLNSLRIADQSALVNLQRST